MRELREIEIVAIGEELLSGATVDTNAAHIARALEPIGLRVVRKTTVGDVASAIAGAVRAALARTGAVITTGGLGPTKDDATKAAVAGVFEQELEFREDLWSDLQALWAHRGKIPEANKSPAEVPVGADIFANPRGTAPGLAIDDPELGLCILLPGVPGEMKVLLERSVTPYLSERVGRPRRPFRRQLRTSGVAESAIADKVGTRLDDLALEVAYLPDLHGVDIRLTGWATEEKQAQATLNEGASRLLELLGHNVYAEGDVDLVQVVGDLLRQRGLSVAVAESCTGGLVGQRLSEWPGASDFFWGGMIVYEDSAKIELLGVSEATLHRHGAVSEETARAMAEGASRCSGADCALAVTGIAGPSGGSEEKPVGTVWLAASVNDETVTRRRHYPGTRDMVRMRAAQGGLDLLRRTLLRGSP